MSFISFIKLLRIMCAKFWLLKPADFCAIFRSTLYESKSEADVCHCGYSGFFSATKTDCIWVRVQIFHLYLQTFFSIISISISLTAVKAVSSTSAVLELQQASNKVT